MADIIISDLSACRPADRLAREFRPGTWRLVEYETDGFGGTMVYSGPGMASEELTLPLNASGYCAIYLGVHYPGQFGDAHVRVRLADDRAYTLVRGETQSAKDLKGIPEDLGWSHTSKAYRDWQVTEAFWKVADVTGQDLVIGRFHHGRDYGSMYSNLAFVRLHPLSDDELEAWREELPREDTRRLVAMNDGGIFEYLHTREDIRAQLEPYRDSDVELMLWACFKGESCTYRSEVARQLDDDGNPFDRFSYHDRWDEVLRIQEEQGIDFLPEVVEAAHEVGLRIFPSLRLQGPKAAPVDVEPRSFYDTYPEFHCRDREGRRIAHLSLAFPEVRQLWIDLLCEAVERGGFDGVHVIWCRSQPFVLYEEPVIERFRQLHGADPRQLGDPAEDDPRMWQVMGEFVTQFARQLRRAAHELGRRLGKRLEVAHNVNTTRESNLKWGVDVETWVREGLTDYLMPHPTVAKNAGEWLGWLVDLVRDTPVKLYPDLYPRRQPPAASLYSGQTLYDLGCDGITMWDTYSRVYRIGEWAMMKRLGHRDDLARWADEGRGSDYFRVLDLRSIGGRSADPRYYQTNG